MMLMLVMLKVTMVVVAMIDNGDTDDDVIKGARALASEALS